MSLSSVSRWKSLGIVGVVMLAAAAVLIVPAAAAPNYQMGGSIENSLTVTGSGEASGTPDVAYISLGVDITDANPGVAVSKGNEQMNTLSAAISALGIDAKDIQTTSFNVWPEDRYNPQTGNPTGERVYHVQNTLSITVRDISQIGAVIDTGLQSGANSVSGLSFGIADTAALEQEARLKAVEDARTRATQLAEAFGVTLGAPTVIIESFNSIPSPVAYAAMQDIRASVPSISPGELNVNMTITVTFSIGG